MAALMTHLKDDRSSNIGSTLPRTPESCKFAASLNLSMQETAGHAEDQGEHEIVQAAVLACWTLTCFSNLPLAEGLVMIGTLCIHTVSKTTINSTLQAHGQLKT